MLAAAWKGLGYFAGATAVTLGFLAVPLQVAGERKKLDKTVAQILAAHRDIRALETEFETRGSLAQLERWNGDTLRLTAPTPAQFVRDEAQLASMSLSGSPAVQTASLVVPSAPDIVTNTAVQPAVVVQPTATVPAVTKVAVPTPAKTTPAIKQAAAKPAPTPVAKAPPAVLRVAAVQPAPRARLQNIAMLDRKLLSDRTLSDLVSGSRVEASRLR